MFLLISSLKLTLRRGIKILHSPDMWHNLLGSIMLKLHGKNFEWETWKKIMFSSNLIAAWFPSHPASLFCCVIGITLLVV